MASSSFNLTKSSGDAYLIGMVKWESKADTAGNYSSVTATLYVRKDNDSMTLTIPTSGTWSYSLTLNGSVKSGTFQGSVLTSWVEVASYTVSRIDHNADGSKSINIQGSVTGPSGTSFAGKVTSGSKSVALDTIPRASSISCTTANIESNPTITISRASSSFTHTVTYRFGNLTGTIATKTSSTSITSWTIPASFYEQIPNAKEGWGTLTCYTYSGNTLIGTSPCDLYATTDETKCKPTVSGSVVDSNNATIALTGNPEILVRYASKARCSMTALLNKSAGSIKTTTINNTAVSNGVLEIPNVGINTFDFYAMDSREYFNSYKVVKSTAQFISYIPLTNDATIQRNDPTSGAATLTIEGNYFAGSFGATSNSLTVKYRQGGSNSYISVTPKISNNKYSATVDLTGFDYTKSFGFEVVVSDRITTISKTLTLQKGIPVFDWGEEDFNFNVPVTINGVNILEKLAELERRIS